MHLNRKKSKSDLQGDELTAQSACPARTSEESEDNFEAIVLASGTIVGSDELADVQSSLPPFADAAIGKPYGFPSNKVKGLPKGAPSPFCPTKESRRLSHA